MMLQRNATLAGILLAFCIPLRPKFNPMHFIDSINTLSARMKEEFIRDDNIIKNKPLRALVKKLEENVNLVQAPAQLLEDRLHTIVAYFIIPVFALANAGVPINFSALGTTVTHPVTLGIILGLVGGKMIGIAGVSWIAVKAGITELPEGLDFRHIIAGAFMGGIGFTMSIFITELAFAGNATDLLMAKTGVLIASLIAGISGVIWILACCKKVEREEETPLTH